MANNSYIIDKKSKQIIFDNSYEISLVQKILVSANPKIVPSVMYEECFAIEGDYDLGLGRIKEFYSKLIENNICNNYNFQNKFDVFFNTINSTFDKSIILEPEEIFSLDDTQNINDLMIEIQNIDISDCVLEVVKQLEEYKKRMDTISSYPDYKGLLFKRKNKKKIVLLNEVTESIDYYINFSIGI